MKHRYGCSYKFSSIEMRQFLVYCLLTISQLHCHGSSKTGIVTNMLVLYRHPYVADRHVCLWHVLLEHSYAMPSIFTAITMLSVLGLYKIVYSKVKICGIINITSSQALLASKGLFFPIMAMTTHNLNLCLLLRKMAWGREVWYCIVYK